MKFIFEISHPKHFYQFRHLIDMLALEHEILIIARDKDRVFEIINESGYHFMEFGFHGKGMLAKFRITPQILQNYVRIVKQFRPHALISKGSPYSVIVSKLTGVPTFTFTDSEVVPLTNYFTGPLSSFVVTPRNFERSFGEKHLRIDGLFENCYLDPAYFQPREDLLRGIGVEAGEPYAIARFVGWFANHDVARHGLNLEEKQAIVDELRQNGLKVFISSEIELPTSLQQYRLQAPATHIHHLLHFASLYIGDSQTMAAEAALLGTPAIRCNSFVGEHDMSNFRLLEQKYGLMFNVRTGAEVVLTARRIMTTPNVKSDWLQRRACYFADTRDVNRQIVDYLESRV
jgi:uncharacterized protein